MDLLTKGFVLLAALAVTTQVPARAGTAADDVAASITRTLESRYPKLKVLDVRAAPLPALYEVYTGTEILYTDKSGDYLFSGSLLDTRTKKDLTAEGVDARNAIDFATLPFDKAIKVVRGTGQRRLAIFTDPDCPYCQALEKEMKDVTDVTLYTFLFPLTQIHPNAERHARAIWCAEDRGQAWTAWMQEKKEPDPKPCDGAPIEELSALGEKLHIAGTPTLYFETGRRLSHGLSAADLEQSLNDNAKAASGHGSAAPSEGCPAPGASGSSATPSCTFDTGHKKSGG
jgi:thiol:disulfide interchange protein DsbC